MTTSKSIFVFGSNLAGIHGKGAARHAKEKWGAQQGVGEGLAGDCYALPTKDRDIRTLPIEAIKEHVNRFLDMARERMDLVFQVTRIGCGLAGYQDVEIAPLFKVRPPNVILPGVWLKMEEPDLQRLIVAGLHQCPDKAIAKAELDAMIKSQATLVSGCSNTASEAGHQVSDAFTMEDDWLVHQYAHPDVHAVTTFPPQWKRFGTAAPTIRNQTISWYGTELLAFWDGQSPDVKNLIDTARADGLAVKVVDISSRPTQAPAKKKNLFR